MTANEIGDGSDMYRVGEDAVDYEPELYRMSVDEMESKAREKERGTRRLRRTQRSGQHYSGINPAIHGGQTSKRNSETNEWKSAFTIPPSYNPKTIAYQFYVDKSTEPNHNFLHADSIEAKRSLIAKNRIPSLATGSRRRTSVGVTERDLIEQLDLMIENKAATSTAIFEPAGDEVTMPSLRRVSDSSSISTGSSGSQGPRVHRGFGASAGQFNKGKSHFILITRWTIASWRFQTELALLMVSIIWQIHADFTKGTFGWQDPVQCVWDLVQLAWKYAT
jgi:hypothetical protein